VIDLPVNAASLNVTIVDSEASNNGDAGVFAQWPLPGRPTAVMVRNSVASYNGVGLNSEAIIRTAHSVVTGNNTGVSVSAGGKLFSYGDNDIDGNTNNNTAALTPLAMH
jgi:hypothetical protein